MSSAHKLHALRGRNKDSLSQLKQEGEKVGDSGDCCLGRKRDREDEAEDRRRPGDTFTRAGGAGAPPGTAHTKPTVRFADTSDACETETGFRRPVSTSSVSSRHGGTAQPKDSSDDLKHSESHERVQDSLSYARPHSSKSCLVNSSKEQMAVRNQEIPAPDRRHLRPLLGYDWIAGVLDAEDTFVERSDEFFSDLHIFRSLHKEECVHSPNAEFSEEDHSGRVLPTEKDDPEAYTDTHKCTFSYRINSRLFPVPLQSRECCPVCKKHKCSHPHTAAEPALVRISIPHSALLPPHEYKAHRRCSFDPSDSLGLPSHCLSGWSHTGQSSLQPPSSLDLRSSLNTESSAQSQSKELKNLSLPKVPSDQISNMSKLARYNFQHFPTRKKKNKYQLNV